MAKNGEAGQTPPTKESEMTDAEMDALIEREPLPEAGQTPEQGGPEVEEVARRTYGNLKEGFRQAFKKLTAAPSPEKAGAEPLTRYLASELAELSEHPDWYENYDLLLETLRRVAAHSMQALREENAWLKQQIADLKEARQRNDAF
jgi:hypothetical protein